MPTSKYFDQIETGHKVVQWSAVRVTAVTVTVGCSDSFGNPRFINYYKSDTIRVTEGYSDTFAYPRGQGVTVTADHCNRPVLFEITL